MKFRLRRLVEMLCVVGASALSQASEPNDTVSTATSSGLVGIGTALIEGVELGDGDWVDRDVDLYAFEIDKPTALPVLVTIDMASSSPGLDGYLRLFDAAGVELANNDDRSFTEFDPLIQAMLLASGTYYVGVSSTANPHYCSDTDGSGRPGAGGTYALTISTESTAIPTSTLEPNDMIGGATPMGSGSFTVSGEVIGDGEHAWLDVDIYKLHLTQGARVDVHVRAESIGSVLDPVVRIRNCTEGIDRVTEVDGCLLGIGDDTPNGSSDALASGGALEAQDVYILVSGAGNRRFDPAVSGSGEIGSVGPYEL